VHLLLKTRSRTIPLVRDEHFPGTPIGLGKSEGIEPAGWSERESAVQIRDKSDTIGGCLPSLTLSVRPSIMSFRADSELKTAFCEAARTLDAQLDRARARLVSEGVTIEDRSNRTGFDKSGIPYFLWSLWFGRRRPYGPEIASVLVDLSYLESPEVGGTPEISERWVAEVFQPGQVSRIRREGQRSLSYETIVATDMAALVLQSIERAEHELPNSV